MRQEKSSTNVPPTSSRSPTPTGLNKPLKEGMTRTAIIAAFPGELAPLVRHWQHEHYSGIDLWRWVHDAGAPEEGEWIAACAGAGQTAATRAFAAAEQYGQSGQPGEPSGHLDLALSVGWAGALHPVLEPGLAYAVCGVIDARTGEITPAADWRQDLWLVTSPKVADEAEKRRLAASYGASLVDMEAAAVARLAAMRNIPFYCVKGVSDGFYDELPDFNRFIAPDGRFQTARFTLFALLRPWLWHSLQRMRENSRKAADGIAGKVLDILDEKGHIRIRNGYPDRNR
jgi:adenosylhomocysteine nucleosidase